MTKNILQSAAPNLAGQPIVEFRKPDFDAVVWQKGYKVIIEKALRCPCHAPDAPLIDCQNCYGTGYFYINPLSTIALMTNLNQNNYYKNWSETLMGTVEVTVRDIDKPNLGYFNRITVKDQFSYFSENCVIRSYNEDTFVFTTYKPVELISLHIFNQYDKKLIKLSEEEYELNPNNPYSIILKLKELPINGIVSIYYKHEPEYHVIDLPHEIRASFVKDKPSGKMQQINLPIQAIARRSHLIAIGIPNFDGTGTINNDNI